MDNRKLLQLKGISKSFPGVKALEDINIDIYEGEIHSIVGENGAGKSTLMNILSGVYAPNEGQIVYEGEIVKMKDTHHSQQLGISMIHQELSLASHLSVLENMYVGRLSKNKFGFINYRDLEKKCKEDLEYIGVTNIDPKIKIEELSVSEMQMVEIAKALTFKSKILIMDEPTSSLTQKETEALISVMNSLKKTGVSIIFISHKMEEVFRLSDRITVLRDGKHIKTLLREDATINAVLSLMVGREFDTVYTRHKKVNFKYPVLEVENLSDGKRISDVKFKLHAGEVLAITGLVGSGRTEILQTIFGINKRESGIIKIDGKEVVINKPTDAIKYGIALVPEGRKTQGLLLDMTVRENISIANIQKENKFGLISLKKEQDNSNKYIKKMSIKTPSSEQKIRFLSGGNQQKAIIGRWLLNEPRVLFMDEPTHGIDIGAKSEIYEIIDDLSSKGVGIVLISSEMPEVLSLADRIIVMHNGRISGELTHDEATQDRLMQLAANQQKI